MKGLLLKDFFTLSKSLRIFLVLILLFACMPGYNMAIFAVVYASLLPVTALSYDERCKWDTLAAMSPYSPAEMVISKYLLGYIGILFASMLALAVHAVYGLFSSSPAGGYVSSIAGGAVSGLLIIGLTLPAMYKFGVEKGRIAFFVILAVTFGAVAGLSALSDNGELSGFGLDIGAGTGILILLAVILLNAASILLSIKFYSKREF